MPCCKHVLSCVVVEVELNRKKLKKGGKLYKRVMECFGMFKHRSWPCILQFVPKTEGFECEKALKSAFCTFGNIGKETVQEVVESRIEAPAWYSPDPKVVLKNSRASANGGKDSPLFDISENLYEFSGSLGLGIQYDTEWADVDSIGAGELCEIWNVTVSGFLWSKGLSVISDHLWELGSEKEASFTMIYFCLLNDNNYPASIIRDPLGKNKKQGKSDNAVLSTVSHTCFLFFPQEEALVPETKKDKGGTFWSFSSE